MEKELLVGVTAQRNLHTVVLFYNGNIYIVCI